MKTSTRVSQGWLIIAGLLIAAQLVMGCSVVSNPGQALQDLAQRVLASPTAVSSGVQAPAGGATPVSTPPSVVRTPAEADASARPVSPATPSVPAPSMGSSQAITMTLWTIEALAPDEGTPAGQLLAQQLESFSQAHPGVAVRYVLKQPYGRAGILQFLRATKKVAPEALPDLVVIDTAEVAQAAHDGLLQPLDPLLSRDLANDMFPFAWNMGRVGDEWMAVPFVADLEHLVYNLNKTPEAPVTWTDVLSSTTTYLFPAAGRDGQVNAAFLVQYLALGGRLTNESGQPALSREALAQVLTFYDQGHELGIIPDLALKMHTPAECWPYYLSAQVGMTNVRASHFLVERAQLRRSQVAGIPTRDGVPTTLATGWAYAITTQEPSRVALAAQLIEWLMGPEHLGPWTQAAGQLPTRRAALDLWPDDPYRDFLRSSLEQALHLPSVVGYDRLSRVMQRAVEEVLTGVATPEDAAARAVQGGL
jgi:multiple sugar transport system substrate-binding protein